MTLHFCGFRASFTLLQVSLQRLASLLLLPPAAVPLSLSVILHCDT
jgi:hypothetical protein